MIICKPQRVKVKPLHSIGASSVIISEDLMALVSDKKLLCKEAFQYRSPINMLI